MFVDEANHICISMLTYNLIEYSHNCLDPSESLWQFIRDQIPANNAGLSIENSKLFKYKPALVGKTAANNNSFVKNTKIVVPLNYLSNFRRTLEMPLINWKTHLELNWIGDCILSSAKDSAKFKIMFIGTAIRLFLQLQ